MRFKVVDNSDKVMRAMFTQMGDAANEIKETALDSVLWMMLHGYDEPHGEDGHTEIYDTGALYQSIESKVDNVYNSGIGINLNNNVSYRITVSANTEYASYVHQGTSKLHGRPFITDGINRVKPTLKQITEKHMKG